MYDYIKQQKAVIYHTGEAATTDLTLIIKIVDSINFMAIGL